MQDVHDTIVDPQIRREVEPPRPDARRPVLLIAIVVTAALAGAAAMALIRGPRAAPSPRPAVPPAVVAPVAPVAPSPVVAPTASPAARPCPSYGQRHLDDGVPRRADCLAPPP